MPVPALWCSPYHLFKARARLPSAHPCAATRGNPALQHGQRSVAGILINHSASKGKSAHRGKGYSRRCWQKWCIAVKHVPERVAHAQRTTRVQTLAGGSGQAKTEGGALAACRLKIEIAPHRLCQLAG
jgi:hypothetical protein